MPKKTETSTVLSLYNEKGGVGKSTLSAILGAGLAMKGYMVLLIDADGQADLTKNLKVPMGSGFYNMIKRNNSEEEEYVPTKKLLRRPPQDRHPDNLYIIPGNNETWGIPMSTRLQSIVGNLTLRITDLSRVFDYIIFDNQPSASTIHDAIALVTDYFIIPTDAEPLAAYGGVKNAIEHIHHVHEQTLQNGHNKANLLGIVPNKYLKQTKLHQHMLNELKQAYGDYVWQPIPRHINIAESQLRQATLMQEDPNLAANIHLWNFIDRVETATQEATNG